MTKTGFRRDRDGLWSIDKDPAAELEYGPDLTQWLADGETVTGVTWTVPAGLTKLSDSGAGPTPTVKLGGGSAGVTYQVTCTFTTSASRKDARTFRINVKIR